jgi:hypothetical protein
MSLRHARVYEARMRQQCRICFCARSKSDAGLISVEALKTGLICPGTGERDQNPGPEGASCYF